MKSRDSLYLNLGKAYLATDQKQKCRETLELLFKEFPGSIYIKPAKGVMDKCNDDASVFIAVMVVAAYLLARCRPGCCWQTLRY
jgi:hypothetical protein